MLGRSPWQVVADRQDPLADPLVEHMLALNPAVRPVLPTVIGLLNAVPLRHQQGVLEGFLQVRPQHLGHVPPNQCRRWPATGEHDAVGIDHKDIHVLDHKLALAAERGKRLVAIVVVIGQGFFQQGQRGLVLRLRLPGRLGLPQAHHQQPAQQGDLLRKPHCASLVLVDVSRA
ncbi:hypothetical protein D3C85_1074760 [compost metagenome]